MTGEGLFTGEEGAVVSESGYTVEVGALIFLQ